MVDIWYTSKVFRGTGGGKKLGFPTINLDPSKFVGDLKEGVYSCLVDYKNSIYLGALYFGPRFISNETELILEIYMVDFDKEIYGKTVEFKVGEFIREAKKFSDTKSLIEQIKKDVEKIRSL
ncbi:MAG: Riboflavin kinase [Candidatus Roizmanbacteria bacterium GW2011_GWC2_37_13]|uniref:riboflavin kinase n=1 Tax=Candidatus Roizmanbacteria bacterium GW2011_GWC2_37_13 TaxID=1618486 RepID=A0A0G0G2T8_9BACT|nr:MAG: Riboflavin kinase [Candidatus Roizmanbacteria bacterium GW2011_GWC1_37_12]KKQ24312.1 MAG: Riboflavin kinase [Candidatus Roizmanbacteria bacterium GW2011_GWC2_37_13]